MTTGIRNTGQGSWELADDERAAVNRMCAQVHEMWEQNGRKWEFVDLLRAMNAGAAQVVKLLQERSRDDGPEVA